MINAACESDRIARYAGSVCEARRMMASAAASMLDVLRVSDTRLTLESTDIASE